MFVFATRTCLCYRLHVMMYYPLYIHEGKKHLNKILGGHVLRKTAVKLL